MKCGGFSAPLNALLARTYGRYRYIYNLYLTGAPLCTMVSFLSLLFCTMEVARARQAALQRIEAHSMEVLQPWLCAHNFHHDGTHVLHVRSLTFDWQVGESLRELEGCWFLGLSSDSIPKNIPFYHILSFLLSFFVQFYPILSIIIIASSHFNIPLRSHQLGHIPER